MIRISVSVYAQGYLEPFIRGRPNLAPCSVCYMAGNKELLRVNTEKELAFCPKCKSLYKVRLNNDCWASPLIPEEYIVER